MSRKVNIGIFHNSSNFNIELKATSRVCKQSSGPVIEFQSNLSFVDFYEPIELINIVFHVTISNK